MFVFLYLLEAVVSRVGEYSPNLVDKSGGIFPGRQGHSLFFETFQHSKGRLVVLAVAVGADEVVTIE